jgi:import receptor subunit TOM20
MNVKVNTVDVPDGNGQTMRKMILTVTKDYKAGEVIYKARHFTYIVSSNINDLFSPTGASSRHCPRLRP